MILRTLSPDPRSVEWGLLDGRRRVAAGAGRRSSGGGPLDAIFGAALGGAEAAIALGRAGVELGRASLDDGALSAPYWLAESALGGHLEGQRRFATQQYDLAHLTAALRSAADCTLNDIVLYLSAPRPCAAISASTARFPSGSLTAGIPVNLREADDREHRHRDRHAGRRPGHQHRRSARADRDDQGLDRRGETPSERATAGGRADPYTLLLNGPYIAGLIAGLGGSAPAPFSVAISNVPGPTETLYFNGAKLDALFPLSLLTHGNALNITCLSYAGTLNFGFTGARDTLPHLQRLALYMGDSLDEI